VSRPPIKLCLALRRGWAVDVFRRILRPPARAADRAIPSARGPLRTQPSTRVPRRCRPNLLGSRSPPSESHARQPGPAGAPCTTASRSRRSVPGMPSQENSAPPSPRASGLLFLPAGKPRSTDRRRRLAARSGADSLHQQRPVPSRPPACHATAPAAGPVGAADDHRPCRPPSAKIIRRPSAGATKPIDVRRKDRSGHRVLVPTPHTEPARGPCSRRSRPTRRSHVKGGPQPQSAAPNVPDLQRLEDLQQAWPPGPSAEEPAL